MANNLFVLLSAFIIVAFYFLGLAVIKNTSYVVYNQMLKVEYFLCDTSHLSLVFCSNVCISRISILFFFLSSDDSAEFNLVNNALLSIFKMDAKGKGLIFL